MPIEFRCTQCGKLLRTGDDTAGKQAKCPACGTLLVIPEPGVAVLQPIGPQPPHEEQRAGGPLGPQPADSAPPWQSETNPYQSPTIGGAAPLAAASSDLARSRVAGPAIALMVTGGLGIAAQLLRLAAGLAQIALVQAQPRGGDDFMALLVFGGIGLGLAVLSIILGAVVIYGAMQMKDLRSYSLSMTSAIVAMIPCLSPCCLLGLPFGIWAIVVISSPEVKSAFRG